MQLAGCSRASCTPCRSVAAADPVPTLFTCFCLPSFAQRLSPTSPECIQQGPSAACRHAPWCERQLVYTVMPSQSVHIHHAGCNIIQSRQSLRELVNVIVIIIVYTPRNDLVPARYAQVQSAGLPVILSKTGQYHRCDAEGVRCRIRLTPRRQCW